MVEDNPRSHRHDGSSPLPFSMDASPAPIRWTGAHTTWPHDPRSGWSYCVMIPAWITLPEPKTSDAHDANPTVFYRVQVGVQSPQGISSLHEIIRRFSDFLQLHVTLKRMFPKKKLPLPPPKKSLMRVLANKNHLQQRRLSLLEWIIKLLADIDVSRSAPMASFLELEVAARLAVPDTAKHTQQYWEEKDNVKHESTSLHTKRISLDQEERLAFVDTTLAEHEDVVEATSSMTDCGEATISWQAHRRSVDSDLSESSFASGSEFSHTTTIDFRDHNFESLPTIDAQILKAVHALLPVDQRGHVRRVLLALQRSVTMAKADMEELVVRLKQATSLKDFLTAKVKDLEVEFLKLKRTSLESLEQAVLEEREGYRNLQWELEESRTALARAEEEARLSHEAKVQVEERVQELEMENSRVSKELQGMNEKLQLLQLERDNIKTKAVAETRVLAKEIKALRKSQPDLKQKLDQALRTKDELEAQVKQYQLENENRERILHDVGALCERLQQCTVDSLAKEDAGSNKTNNAISDAADLLVTSDSRIGLLLAEAQLLAEEEDDHSTPSTAMADIMDKGASSKGGGSNEPLRRMLTAIFIDNAHLHKLVNSLTLKALALDSKEKPEAMEAPSRKSVLNRFL